MSLKIDSDICPILKLFISSFLAFFIWMKNTFLLCYGLGGWGGVVFLPFHSSLCFLGWDRIRNPKSKVFAKALWSRGLWTPEHQQEIKSSQDKLLSWGSQPNYQELRQVECIQGTDWGRKHSGTFQICNQTIWGLPVTCLDACFKRE